MLMVFAAFECVTMLVVLYTRKTYPGFRCWTLGYASFFIGFLCVMLRGVIPDFFSVVAANLLITLAPVLYYEGAKRFRGIRGRPVLGVLLLLAAAFVQGYFLYVHNDVGVRIACISLILGTAFGMAAWVFFLRVPRELKGTYWLTGGIFAFYSLFMFFRGTATFLSPGPQDLFVSDAIQTATFLLPLFLSIGWTFGFLLLNSQRLELDLRAVQSELEVMVRTDYLTGAANNRHFFECAEREFLRAQRYGRPLSLIMVDMDRFKELNDTYGHAAGDQALVAVVATVKPLLRDMDTMGRLGGDEFAILLPETDRNGGLIIAERLWQAIRETPIPAGGSTIHLAASMGVAALEPGDQGIQSVLKRADGAMYRAKKSGSIPVGAS